MQQLPPDYRYEVPPGYYGSEPPRQVNEPLLWQPAEVPVATHGRFPAAAEEVYYSDKSKVIAGLLQIFLNFGIGRFYTGHTGLGLIQLICCVVFGIVGSIFTCGISALVFWWPFIDGIVILVTDSTDARGMRLR